MTVFPLPAFRKQDRLRSNARRGVGAIILQLAHLLCQTRGQRHRHENDPLPVVIFHCARPDEFAACLRFAAATRISWSVMPAERLSTSDAGPRMSLRQLEIEIEFAGHLLIVTDF
jgi:hypothetical protein